MSIHERLLIHRLKQRDEVAFTEVVRLYQHKVFNLLYRMVGNREEAEDVAQEVFVTVFKNVDGFRGDSKFSTWLYRVAANHCKNRIKYLARRNRTTGDGLDGVPERGMEDGGQAPLQSHIDGPDKVLEGRQLEALVQRAMALLDEEHRLLIILRDVEDLSYQEIAEITSQNEGTVKSRLHRARMAIKEYVEKHTG
ncbi:MAG TPA: sigma-70 family RNA polymerase sigma factor [Polyangia bacterium]|jgi:RNA polymerase sigma-70 factor (ECF subfamily)